MWEDFLLVLSIRFFLFDFVLFHRLRQYLKKHYVFRKLFSCTFCQGFWCGLLVALFNKPFTTITAFGIHIFKFSFIAAILSFAWTVSLHPLIKKFEAENELPMTKVLEKQSHG